MLNLCKYLLILIVLFLNAVSFSEFEIKISSEKIVYLEAEPVIISIEFFNNKNENDSIKCMVYDQFYDYLKLTSAENKKFVHSGVEAEYEIYAPAEVFGPFEKKLIKFDLLDYRGDIEIFSHKRLQRLYLSKGDYSIYYNGIDKSNILTLSIIEPAGKEKNVFNDLVSVLAIEDSKNRDSKINIRRSGLYKLAAENFNSVYWEYAVFVYNRSISNFSADTADISLNAKFVENRPDSYFLNLIFRNLCRAIFLKSGSESDVIKYLNKILENFKIYSVFDLANDEIVNKHYLK